jgi:hypothetical protein
MINLDFVTIKKMAILTGYTEKAIRRKIQSGVWDFFVKAPDNHVLISLEGFHKWVKGNTKESKQPANLVLDLVSPVLMHMATKDKEDQESKLSPQMKI